MGREKSFSWWVVLGSLWDKTFLTLGKRCVLALSSALAFFTHFSQIASALSFQKHVVSVYLCLFSLGHCIYKYIYCVTTSILRLGIQQWSEYLKAPYFWIRLENKAIKNKCLYPVIKLRWSQHWKNKIRGRKEGRDGGRAAETKEERAREVIHSNWGAVFCYMESEMTLGRCPLSSHM